MFNSCLNITLSRMHRSKNQPADMADAANTAAAIGRRARKLNTVAVDCGGAAMARWLRWLIRLDQRKMAAG